MPERSTPEPRFERTPQPRYQRPEPMQREYQREVPTPMPRPSEPTPQRYEAPQRYEPPQRATPPAQAEAPRQRQETPRADPKKRIERLEQDELKH